MEKLFLTVLGMSGAASVSILIVLLARLVLRRAPKAFSYALWAVVLFRLLCPFPIESVFSLIPAVRTMPAGDGQSVVQIQPPVPALSATVGAVNDYLYAHPYQTAPSPVQNGAASGSAPEKAAVLSWKSVVCGVWLAGTAVLLLYSLISLLRLRGRLVEAMPLAGETNVLLADHIPSPFVLGLLRPRIYLPSDLPETERDYILLHERTHIRRGDPAVRALAWLAVTVHWFNPLVWLAFHLAGRDMEMSCDEAVLRRMGRGIRADYSESLLRLSVGGKFPIGPLTFGDSDPKRRIKHVLSYRKPALWVVVIAFLAVIATGAAVITSQTADRETEELTADVSFSIGEQGNVEIAGHVGDFALEEGTFWHPAADAEHPITYLAMQYRSLESGIAGCIEAWWEDDSRTSVLVTTLPLAQLSGEAPVGYWNFTVALSDAGDAVTAMASQVLQAASEEETVRFYPESVSNEDAIALARIAALLLTEAEEYYTSSLVYHISERSTVIVEGWGETYTQLVWTPDKSHGWLYVAGDLSSCCNRLTGRTVEGSARWTDNDKTTVYVSMDSTDNQISDGTAFYIRFVADLASGTVTEQPYESDLYGEMMDLSETEMLAIGAAMADVLNGAEDFFLLHEDELGYRPAPELELDPVYILDSLGVSVEITGLDCHFAQWYARSPSGYEDVPQTLGYLDLADPRCLGEAFAASYQGVTAVFEDSDHTRLTMGLMGRGDTMGGICTVNLFSGEISGGIRGEYDSERLVGSDLSPQELLSAARALADLIWGALDYYTEAANVPPEEGPLPFDQPMKLWFGSGAGAWNTILTLHPDGSFEGNYHDSENAGQYQYVCQFHGTFEDIAQASGASWTMTLDELVLDTSHPIGEEWTEDGIHYVSSNPYGFDDNSGEPLPPGAQFIFYTPEATGHEPGTELYGLEGTADFWGWWPNRHSFVTARDTLGCYGLRNVETGYGFFDLYAWGLA